MVPPHNVTFKIGNELFRRGEEVGSVLAGNVPMITFSNLIVEAHDTITSHHIRQSVLIPMS